MATLHRLALGNTALASKVAGVGVQGNDQQLKTLLLGARNRHKKSPWGANYSYCSIERCDTGLAERYPRIIFGRAETGLWVKNVFVHVTRWHSTAETSDNVMTVQMWKSATLAGGWTPFIDSPAVAPDDEATYPRIIPTVTIRGIRDADDDVHMPLPIEMDYIAAGEYWYLLFTPPSTSSMGWQDADVLIHFAELHRS